MAQKPKAQQTYSEQIAELVERPSPTAEAVWRMLGLLSRLHCGPDGTYYADPPGHMSGRDRTRVAKIIADAKAGPGQTAMDQIAVEWSALLALIADGETTIQANPVAYFLSRFGKLEAARKERGTASLPMRGDEIQREAWRAAS